MDKDQELMESLEKEGVLKKGHFVLSGGNHSDKYVDHDVIYAKPFLVTVCGHGKEFLENLK
ncbi:MAG: hypothetical protein A2931_03745 [Candidatus Niyogibacteria bacterium RIFCSPLOWO2_01_FULL_45_48]|uniref:Orotate phosphoribosyltransferase n=2 Tax=Candidatus Niyogiibacteriota TaxID=1817912 RepID=A0A1G2EWL5_9BACT|nr:MAG: hypothetical protein A2835_03845 [Candidatus Niyogibacteria bacterium RIFCSPHIGHO2_01_FULL_45_28]OGZ30196.1 MAG: hypothetical protein A3J00_00820 [Candidatus Niyogibacteria bacterium RIFCSPLOWO2_02_FULL_45_13]OGZ30942.1 MAG: hypothetical protein A2931_03745 [Candidatus Niyogibacteria bacterium RIFCSPLOWO2_01_FULL_45_48]